MQGKIKITESWSYGRGKYFIVTVWERVQPRDAKPYWACFGQMDGATPGEAVRRLEFQFGEIPV